jgi:hypothetical protein
VSYRRILLFSLLFLVLILSSLYYVLLQSQQKPLRKDPIPEGAYVAPWMRPNPSIKELNLHAQQPYGPPPFDIDSVMANALKLNMTFNISIPGGTRVISSTVYLGHDSEYLYVGGKFCGMGLNPASTPNCTVPHVFSVFFDVADDGVLKQPESGSSFEAYITERWIGGWSYDDIIWVDYVGDYDRASWIPSGNYYTYYLGKPQTVFGIEDGIKEYDNSTGTVTMLFSRRLFCAGNAEVNALQMRPGERWVMGFLIELSYVTNTGRFGDYVDGWPRNIYPYLSNDSSWWPKLCIDLTNQPLGFPPNQETPNQQNLSSLQTTPAHTINFARDNIRLSSLHVR